MFSRCSSIASVALLLSFASLFIGTALAATDDKTRLGNSTIDRTLQLRTHSIYAPYIDQDLQNRWWDFGADAYVNTNKYIRLTRNRPSQMGWLWSRLALTASNFVIEVEFKVSGDPSHLYGDGLAMWLTKDRAAEGPVFGSKDQFTGLGIFLDTYANEKHTYSFPRIVGILGDGKMKYDFGRDGEGQELGSCSANFRRTNVATKLKVTYVKDTFLDVKIQYKAWDDWTDCFHVEKVALPTNPFLGFSAMTGDVSDAHDIISVNSYSAILSQPESAPNKHKKTSIFSSAHPDAAPGAGTWLGLLFKLILLGGVVAGGYYGWQEYQRRQRYGGFGGGMGGGGMGGGSGYGMRSAGVGGGFGDYGGKRY
ncbi:lectin [Pholiota molesta]|nr:lectin [Pholiota molesta]